MAMTAPAADGAAAASMADQPADTQAGAGVADGSEGGGGAPAAAQRNAKLYFDVGSSTPPANASADLAGVLAALKDDANAKARISGFHDETGSAATNAELAKKRAQAVQSWLESQGIAADRIVLDKPAVTEGGGKPEEARRVEVSVE
ncbi:OmpA family protein [Lysobacter capsici]|uniref:OmpA family protein n=2 Tax=Lysobacter capsici TaxID=435897 RepID=UPI00287B9E95|nr:OmpA family protein [Lysobacter capsici]WND83171.1 OmpA family protein [Lysobacter capsici]WND88370.1 OmpA family protein [Lysobacter capsici]